MWPVLHGGGHEGIVKQIFHGNTCMYPDNIQTFRSPNPNNLALTVSLLINLKKGAL